MTPPEFILIPYILSQDKNITPVEEKTYGIIYWLTQLKRKRCTASNQTLALLVGTTNGKIGNSLTKLEKYGYIKRIFKDEKRKIREEIITLVVLQKVSLNSERVSLNSETGITIQCNEVSLNSEQNKNSKQEKKHTHARAWNFFLETFPKRTKIKEAEVEFNKLTEEEIEKALKHINQQKYSEQWTSEEGRYVPNAFNYINEKRWKTLEVKDLQKEIYQMSQLVSKFIIKKFHNKYPDYRTNPDKYILWLKFEGTLNFKNYNLMNLRDESLLYGTKNIEPSQTIKQALEDKELFNYLSL